METKRAPLRSGIANAPFASVRTQTNPSVTMTPAIGLLLTKTLPRKNLPEDFGAAQNAVDVVVNAAQVAADFKNSRRFIGLDMFGKLINTPDDPVLHVRQREFPRSGEESLETFRRNAPSAVLHGQFRIHVVIPV